MTLRAWLQGTCFLLSVTLASGAVATACGGKVVVDTSGSTDTTSGSTTSFTYGEGAIEGAIEGAFEPDCACACSPGGACATLCDSSTEPFCQGQWVSLAGDCAQCLMASCGFVDTSVLQWATICAP
jgi:hypothetical protein